MYDTWPHFCGSFGILVLKVAGEVQDFDIRQGASDDGEKTHVMQHNP